jgi:nicotinate-nucleotide adenylyltransferase
MNVPCGGKRVAFFGGSFDPPHLGHLAVARAARAALSLDTVYFAPVGGQPLKPHGATASFQDRVEMTRLAIAGEPGFCLSLADAPKAGGVPNYSFDTLFALRSELSPESNLFCLMGADSFLALRHWRRSAEIPFVAPLIVASRPGQPLDDLRAALPAGLTMEIEPAQPDCADIEVRLWALLNQAGERAPFYLLPGLNVDVSASQIRDQARASGDGLFAGAQVLPTAVSEYIRAHGLYL